MKISTRKRNLFMRQLLKAAREKNGLSISVDADEIKKLRRRADFDATLLALEGLGLVQFVRNPSNGKLMWYNLTLEGRSYFERRADARRSFIFSSIVVPVMVSVLTTAVTAYILPPLGRRVEVWLEHSPEPTQPLSPTPSPTCGPSETPQPDPTSTIQPAREALS